VKERAFKAIIAACVLGAAVMAVWAFARLRDGGAERPAGQVVSAPRGSGQPEAASPVAAPVASARRRPTGAGKPVGAPQLVPPSRSVYSNIGMDVRPAPVAKVPRRPEEIAVRRVLEPLVSRRPNAELPFVRCLDPGGWKQPAPAEGAEPVDDPLDVPGRDPEQAVCRARLRARERADLVGLLRDASGAYKGHLAATDVREHLDAYLGRWFETDIQVDTEEPFPLVDP
jgi:hypothetical protein